MFYKIMRPILWFICKLVFRLKVHGIQNMPEHGRVVICANHISMLDCVVVMVALKRKTRYMAKKELFENKFMAKLFTALGAFPVDRSKTDITAYKTAIKILNNDEALTIFAEGTRVKDDEMHAAKSGIVMFAHKTKSPIVPFYISGNYKLFRRMTVVIGEPIVLDEYYDKKLSSAEISELAQTVMNTTRQLGGDIK